jgi:hypothetical protein
MGDRVRAADNGFMDTTEMMERFEVIEQRLAEHAEGPTPTELTNPDEGGTERWEAAQVWAHMAEFVGYWQAQLEKVIDNYSGTPVPFGRTKDDAGRIGGIEEGRHNAIAELMAQVHDEIEVTRRYLPTLTDEQWQSVGLHPTRGELQPPRMVEIFFLDHLEEHADQLDSLRG